MAVHMVGSTNLADTETVFRTACGALGEELSRVPDGEVGRPFGQWLMPKIFAHPAIYPGEGGPIASLIPLVEIKADFTGPIEFDEFGIAAAAKESYALFSRLKREGVVPAGTRFQMGTPSAVTLATLGSIPAQPRLVEAIGQAIERELGAACDAIPHQELAIQLELPGEVSILEGVFPWWQGTELEPLASHVKRLAAVVPPDVELGVHLCYGDPPPAEGERGQHWADPKDLGVLVSLANAIAGGIARPLQFIHMPVPIARDDEDYFRPLKDLRLPPETQLFLGLVHDRDGIEGSERRIAAARTAYENFGVATECGMGRLPSEIIPGLLDLHRATAEALA